MWHSGSKKNLLLTIKTLSCVSHLMWSFLQGKGHIVNVWFIIWKFALSGFNAELNCVVVEGNFVFWFGAQFNSTHNFTQLGWPILFILHLLSGQQKLGKLPNTLSLAEQHRPVQMSHWQFFNSSSSSSMDTWGNLSNLWIPCVYFLLDQGIPLEYELDTFNMPHTGTTLSPPKLAMSMRCLIPHPAPSSHLTSGQH